MIELQSCRLPSSVYQGIILSIGAFCLTNCLSAVCSLAMAPMLVSVPLWLVLFHHCSPSMCHWPVASRKAARVCALGAVVVVVNSEAGGRGVCYMGFAFSPVMSCLNCWPVVPSDQTFLHLELALPHCRSSESFPLIVLQSLIYLSPSNQCSWHFSFLSSPSASLRRVWAVVTFTNWWQLARAPRVSLTLPCPPFASLRRLFTQPRRDNWHS